MRLLRFLFLDKLINPNDGFKSSLLTGLGINKKPINEQMGHFGITIHSKSD